MPQMTCKKCGIDLIPVQRTKGFSLVGLFSAAGFLFSLVVMLFSPAAGIVLAILSILMGTFLRGKDTYLICPKCREETGPL